MMQYKSKYYAMRLESIGGLGANLCGKLLGELGAIYLGLNASSFSSGPSTPISCILGSKNIAAPP